MPVVRSFPDRLRVAGLAIVAVSILVFPSSLRAKNRGREDSQLLLVRGLAYDVAVAKIPLPWGKHGIFVNNKGQIDQTSAMKQLEQFGESVRPGTPVEITGIKFRRGKIRLAINGGGKSGEHWYDHLQIGMGYPAPIVTQDESTTPSNGAYITVSLPRNEAHPTTVQMKKLLSAVLDFHRRSPTVLYSPTIPPKFKKAIRSHKVLVGMSRAAVLSAKGAPYRKLRKDLPDGSEQDTWLYGHAPHVLFVIMVDGTVTKVHQY